MKTLFTFISMILFGGLLAQSGEFQSTSVTAVHASSGSGYGVYGSSLTNYGVYGKSGSDFGVLGESISGYGVRGESTQTYGIYGISTMSYGIYGGSLANNGTGIYGTNNTGTGVEGSGGTQGVYGQSSGGYGVYATSTNSNGLYAKSTNSGAIYGFAASGGAGVIGYSAEGNGVVGSTGTGSSGFDFYAQSTMAAKNYGSASSRRWKENIVNIPDPLGKISQLRGVYFDWKEDHGGHHSLGFIAEEVGEVLPEIVLYESNGIDAKGMDYSKMTPLLVETANAMREEYQEQFVAQQLAIDMMKEEIHELRQMLLDDRAVNLDLKE
ncbi:MAG: tail fiber domain-containing protein [Saprospiraceae bacterium]|nr:tail fiber domain-containing protein [Saprospiraceae bacterium]